MEKVFLLMGCSKNYYNVLGGFYGLYNSMGQGKSVHKLHKIRHTFLVIIIYSAVFCFLAFSVAQKVLQTRLWCTFSFSRRSFAQLCRTSSCSRIIAFACSWHSSDNAVNFLVDRLGYILAHNLWYEPDLCR